MPETHINCLHTKPALKLPPSNISMGFEKTKRNPHIGFNPVAALSALNSLDWSLEKTSKI
jgi:hypothetical protein